VISIAELQFGVLVAKSAEAQAARLARLSTIQRRFEPLPIDEAVADSYGQLAAAVVKAARQPRARTMDLLIAATAHAHDAAVYTRNADDFAGLNHLVEVAAL
jgi:predicted nucleic acid-binding protein